MTVKLDFHFVKAAGKDAQRPVIPGLAKVFFTGAAAIPFMFAAAGGSPTLSTHVQSAPRAARPPLIEAQPAYHLVSANLPMEQLLQSYAGPQTERILDTDVEVDHPDSSLRQMAASYKSTESRSAGAHTCTLIDRSDTFSVITDLKKDSMRVSLRFNKVNDRYDVPVPGARSFDASGFIRLVRGLPEGKNWSATRIFLDKLDGTDIRSVIFLPVDSKGRAVSALGHGGYLAYTLVYYAGCIAEVKPTVIRERGGAYSIPVAGKK